MSDTNRPEQNAAESTAAEAASISDKARAGAAPEPTAPSPEPATKPPFDAFWFHCSTEASGEADVKLARSGQEYRLIVKSGPVKRDQAAHAIVAADFERTISAAKAVELRDALQAAGVFGWDESYGDAKDPGAFSWHMAIDFKTGVFTLETAGGSDVPSGFDEVLEALYRLDLPRPTQAVMKANPLLFPSFADDGADAEPAGAPDGLSGVFGQIPPELLGGVTPEDMREAWEDFQQNPERFREPLRQQFAQLPLPFQNQLLDMLGSSGMRSRAWWEEFLRG